MFTGKHDIELCLLQNDGGGCKGRVCLVAHESFTVPVMYTDVSPSGLALPMGSPLCLLLFCCLRLKASKQKSCEILKMTPAVTLIILAEPVCF